MATTVAPAVEKTVTTVAPKAFKFKVLGGKHYVGDTVYRPGDIVETDDDLVAIHGKPKFELVQG